MSTFNLSAAVQSMLSEIATEVGAVHVATERGWSPLVAKFKEALSESGVTDRKSDGGKAIDAFMSPLVVAALVKTGHYDVAVHRVGSGDEYLPVDAAHPANFTITGAYAVSADLNELPSVKDSPRGMKAWLRGNAENGMRPDGESQGLRDKIKEAKDQVMSRNLWKRTLEEIARGGASKASVDLVDELAGLYKRLSKKRERYEKNGGECLSDVELKVACDRFADEVLKRKSRKAK